MLDQMRLFLLLANVACEALRDQYVLEDVRALNKPPYDVINVHTSFPVMSE